MRITLRTWPEKVEIVTKHDYFNATDHLIISIRQSEDAMRWLRPHQNNSDLIKALRQALVSEKIQQADNMSNPQIIQFITHQLISRKFSLIKTVLLKRAPVIIIKTDLIEESESSVAPTTSIASTAPAPVAEPEDKADHVAQAATLIAAAKKGTPFCDECEKIKKKSKNNKAA